MSFKKIFKIFFSNVSILLIFLLLPGSFYKLYVYINNKIVGQRLSKNDIDLAKLPVYESEIIGKSIFRDMRIKEDEYYPFSAWRPKAFKSENFNQVELDNFSFRFHGNKRINNSVWLFGGSTMWGWAVSDKDTIPSHLQKILKIDTINFGTGGYNSRQSLNLYLNLLSEGYRPRAVVFYDGINEINGCKKSNRFRQSHAQEAKFKKKLSKEIDYLSFLQKINNFVIAPYKSILNKTNFKKLAYLENNLSSYKKIYSCEKGIRVSSIISESLLTNWQTASSISKIKSIPFFAILQPTIHTSISDTSHLNLNKKVDLEWKENNLVIYNNLINKINSKCNSLNKANKYFCKEFYDGRFIINTQEKIFLDHGHLNGSGNKQISKWISKLLDQKL